VRFQEMTTEENVPYFERSVAVGYVDFYMLICSAVRYVMGRRSYVVSTINNLIEDVASAFPRF